MDPLKQALIEYGGWLLATQLGLEISRDDPWSPLIADAGFRTNQQITRARELLGDWSDEVFGPGEPGRLPSIFTFIRYDQRWDETKNLRVKPYDMPRRALSIDLTQTEDQPAEELWGEFVERVGRLQPLQSGWGLFETFTALMVRYGWSVPGTLEDEAVSVYEQFKAVSALAHVLEPDESDVLLVAGDLPGIQDMLYTITSAGVAKALRGRSFYLQLLNDAIVRALLRELELPSSCVVYNAGGNFQLLASINKEGELVTLGREINRRLLELHDGELYLALAWTPMPAGDVSTGAFTKHVQEVGQRLGQQKAQAFAELAEEDYEAVFAPTGFGGSYHCDVCHVDLAEDRKLCDQCASFGETTDTGDWGLARWIAEAQDKPHLAVVDLHDLQDVGDLPSWHGKPSWQIVLGALGYKYRFAGEAQPTDPNSQAHLYRLNDTDCVPKSVNPGWAYGSRFLANTTPRFGKHEDLAQLRDLVPEEERESVRADYIRSTTIMARWDRAGIDRYGVLRMDVDDLGTLFFSEDRLENPNLMRRSAFSGALGLFFEGWLNNLCRRAAEEWRIMAGKKTHDPNSGKRVKTPYIIYSGGDDMLIVGPWDVLPVVAWHVRRDLASYVLRGRVDAKKEVEYPPITVSAGIFAETAKFPLYQATEQAGEALDHHAKKRTAQRTVRGEPELATVKDAVHFVDTTVSWEAFRQAEQLALKIAKLVDVGISDNGGEPDQAPHALIQLLAAVAREYAAAGGGQTDKPLPYGRWMPLLAYGLRRMVDRVPAGNKSLRQKMMRLADDTLDLTRVEDAAQWHTIQFLGLPVRWAEFLIRKGG